LAFSTKSVPRCSATRKSAWPAFWLPRWAGFMKPAASTLGVLHHAAELELEVAERKRAGGPVGRGQHRLQHVVASSPAVLFTVAIAPDQFPRINWISWISDNLLEILGYPPEAALGQDWWLDNVHPEDREEVIEQFQADLLTQERSAYEFRFRHAAGSYRWIRPNCG